MTLLSPIAGHSQTTGTRFRRTDRVEATSSIHASRTDTRAQTSDRRRRNLPVAFDRRGSRRQRSTAPALEATFVTQVLAQAFGLDQKGSDPIRAYSQVKSATVTRHDLKA